MKVREIIGLFGNPWFSQDRLIKWTGHKLIFPFYHTVSDEYLPYISNLYPLKSVNQFEKELDYICKYFVPVSQEAISAQIHSDTKIEKASFHLTFDDGLQEIYSVIAPILEERKIPATFFINTDFVDNRGLFYRYKVGLIIEKLKATDDLELHQKIEELLRTHAQMGKNIPLSLLKLKFEHIDLIDEVGSILSMNFTAWLAEHQPYLTSDQIGELMDRGFTIGSHSASHPKFSEISIETQKEQFLDSFEFLSQNFGVQERLFSFPFSDDGVEKAFFDWIYEEEKCTFSFGVSGLKDDYIKDHLHRIPMDECTGDPSTFIKSEYLYFMLKALFNRNKIIRK